MGWKWHPCDQSTVYQFNRIPQFGELSPREQLAVESSCRATLQHFLDHEFRDAVKDKARAQEAIDMMRVGMMCGHDPLEIMSRVIAGFMAKLIDPKSLEAFSFNFDAYNPEPE